MNDDDGTGIRHPDQVADYVEGTYGETVSSMSPHDRAADLMVEVNQNLANEGVPAVNWTWGESGNTNGSFDASQWSMMLNETNFTDPPNEYDTAVLTARHQSVAQTVYHEARHAEQAYRCCRERAGLGATPEQIHEAMELGSTPVPPMWVIQMAHANPILQCDTSQYEAENWYRSMYGEHSDERREALNHGTYDDYRNLPEEQDGWGARDDVGEGYQQHENQ